MSAVFRATLVLTLTIWLTFASHISPTTAQSNFIDRYMIKGYDHSGSFGGGVQTGPDAPPIGIFDIAQTEPKVGKPGPTAIVALVDAVAFTSPTTAVEVFGIAQGFGAVHPTSTSFSTPGSVDVSVEGIAIFYTFNPLLNTFDISGADFGTIHIASTLSNPASVDNVRERSTLLIRDGLFRHSSSTKTDFRGRFGYGGSGTVYVWFEGTNPLVIAPPGTAINTDDSRYGFVQSGTIASQK